jgi:hypothetical protein
MNVNSEAVEMLKKTQTNLTGIIYRRANPEAVKMLKQNLKTLTGIIYRIIRARKRWNF